MSARPSNFDAMGHLIAWERGELLLVLSAFRHLPVWSSFGELLVKKHTKLSLLGASSDSN